MKLEHDGPETTLVDGKLWELLCREGLHGELRRLDWLRRLDLLRRLDWLWRLDRLGRPRRWL